jgi:phosphoadenosine phosphosulfate reductase
LISFSGGKDSLAVLECCKEAKVPYRYYMKITTVDPPELTKYVKRCHPECVRLRPPGGKSMYEMIERKGLPNRWARWCCEEYKEYPADIERGQHILLGIRSAESKSRKENWGLVKTCEQIGGYKISPILNWADAEVWEFIKYRVAEYCELYDQGYDRIGCIGCPVDSAGRVDTLIRWSWAYVKYRNGARAYVGYRRNAGVGFPAAWEGWGNACAALKQMADEGATIEQIKAQDALYRAEALRWQDAKDPEYLMRRVMAWWLECPVDYWKLDELERYASERRKVTLPR